MLFKSSSVLLHTCLSLSLAISLAAEALAKAAKRAPVNRGTYFVPPPPAYMPSILPELKATEDLESAKPADPAKKYIYTREGYEDPTPVRPNKHVTYWGPADNKL
ncbi:MAG: hypothetical protein HY711_04760 [Candidatus Melainabacteria bacterium]|nr:hypothetical protein [Candidatus Melainabacteria bacterium]